MPSISIDQIDQAPINERAKGFLSNLVIDSDDYQQRTPPSIFLEHVHYHTPQATVISCSDARVQTTISSKPENRLFVIRNIGNQIITAKGSVHFGIDYLKTPVALVIGHASCGAVTAAVGDYTSLPLSVRREVTTLNLTQGEKVEVAVLQNVHNQCAYLLKEYAPLIVIGELLVVGAVYDFANKYGRGHGALIFINVNGGKDSQKIKQHPYFKGVAVKTLDPSWSKL